MTMLISSFAVLLVIGVPIVFVIGLSLLVYFLWSGQTHLLIILPQRMFGGMDQFVLLSIPLFILAGNLMNAGGLTVRLLECVNVIVGRFRGGMSLVTIWSSFLFGGVSGSAAASAAALGSMLIPDMQRQGYDKSYAAALVAVSALLDPLIPPSIAMIIYGMLSGTSIARLFLGGVVPGLLLAVALTAYASWIAHRRGYPRLNSAGWQAVLKALVVATPVLLLPIIIVVGIRGGVFTPTEAAAVAVIYAFAVSAFFYRVMTLPFLKSALVDTALLTAAIYLLIGVANVVTFVFAAERVPQTVVSGLLAITENKILLLLLVNLVLLALGTVLDGAAFLILTVPALTAIGSMLGMDPVHLGVMVVMNMIIGFVTPPVGLCLFIVASIAKAPLEYVSWHILPMVGIAIVILLIVTFVPQVVLFLPNLVVG